MSASRNGYIGRAPADSSVIIARKTYEPTGVQTDFTFAAGYTPGYCDVYINGVKLIDATDYSATNGSTVGLTSAAASGDVVEVVAYKAFNLGVPVSDITGNLDITGNISASSSITVDSGFYGDGSNLSGVAGAAITQYISANSLAVLGSPGVSTITRLGATDLNVTGIITANGLSGNVTGAACTFTTGTFNGNVTIGGTLTYEDVTNVDALGIITARAGVNVSGGEFKVGTALTIGSAGVATFIAPAGVGVTITPSTGKVEATTYYGDGSNLTNITSTTINSNADNRLITGSGTANTLNGESNLTFDGASFKVGSGITMAATAGVVTFANGSTTANNITLGNGKLRLYHNGSNAGYISMDTAEAGTLYIQGTGGSNGNIQIYNTYVAMSSGGSQKLLVKSQGVDIQNGYFKSGVTTATSLTVTGDITANGNIAGDSSTNITGIAGVTASTGSLSSNLTVGSGITFGSAGVSTFSGTADIHMTDGVRLNVGDSSDFSVYHDGSGSYLQANSGGAGNLYLDANGDRGIYIRSGDGSSSVHQAVSCVSNAEVQIYYDNSKKFETTNNGTVTTGVGTFSNGVHVPDDAGISIGSRVSGTTLGDLRLHHNGSHSYIDEIGTGNLYIRNNTDDAIYCQTDAGVHIYYDNSEKIKTTNDGVSITGIATVSQGLNTNGLLSEKFHTTAGKLSDNTNIDLANGMVHYFSTQETTTSTPNIRYNSSKSLNNMLTTGDSITVTIITTAATAGYSAQLNIDGSGQTEEWIGGSAPAAGGAANGHDIYSYTILKTGSTAYKVIANVVNATN